MKGTKGILGSMGGLLVLAIAALQFAGGGFFGVSLHAGEVGSEPLAANLVADREARLVAAKQKIHAEAPSQILFGDLHVHSSFSVDAFQLTLPMSGGDGAHPVADACDFARYCANLDFWSINDHAASLDRRRWEETIDTIRQCQAVAGSTAPPDLTSFLGWEWTQMGSTPENHYGHKNVILRDLEEGSVPARPIAAAPPKGVPSNFDTGGGGRLMRGLGAFLMEGGHEMMRTLNDLTRMEACPEGVHVRDLPADCREAVETPRELFAKLDQWELASLVIPHGTTWGQYTPLGSSFEKQLRGGQHDPNRQRLVEIYSGHGNTEEYRAWRSTEIVPSGERGCPRPSPDYTPSCWRAGEIIRARCLSEAGDSLECEARARRARQHFVEADRNAGPWTVPGVQPADFLDSGQCIDCFQPAFNYRPLGSVQYMLSLSNPGEEEGDERFRFGFIASSDNHTARAGSGYKEVARREFTDARMGEIGKSSLVTSHLRDPVAYSERFDPSDQIPSVAFLETERNGSFFLTGGLAAVHAPSRERDDIWRALERRETYGTSGPRILLWFDLIHAGEQGRVSPMGSEVSMGGTPNFRVRAVGSFEQKPGCPDQTEGMLETERLAKLCRGECYHPSDTRRPITRIEIVRIRPGALEDETGSPAIEDPWKTLPCRGDREGCEVTFSDPNFVSDGRDTAYYVRAIEASSPVIAADPLGCERDDSGRCVSINACFMRPDSDDCLSLSEQRAWSSPIFVDFVQPQEFVTVTPSKATEIGSHIGEGDNRIHKGERTLASFPAGP
ncbi:DUF3604 domain-containing protein [Myxococcota bacterium]|nr:DUF3604 domain-containing protein [Myxococcota bacterium]